VNFDAHKNLVVTTVATAPSPATSGTSLVVSSGDGAKFPAVPFNATISPTPAGLSQVQIANNSEIVRVTARSTDTLTITRAQEGTSARTVVVGDVVVVASTVKIFTDIETAIAELDYVERSTDLAISATTAAGADAWLDGNSVSYDGSTAIQIEVSATYCDTTGALILELYDGSTDLGRFLQVNVNGTHIHAKSQKLTPSAGSHVFHVKAWKVGTANIYAGNNILANALNAWMRITKA
jgi:hypothetical protein